MKRKKEQTTGRSVTKKTLVKYMAKRMRKAYEKALANNGYWYGRKANER